MIKFPSIKAVALLCIGSLSRISQVHPLHFLATSKGEVKEPSEINRIRDPENQLRDSKPRKEELPRWNSRTTSRKPEAGKNEAREVFPEELHIHKRAGTQQSTEETVEEPSQINRIQDLENQLRDSKSREQLYIDKREETEQLVKEYIHGYSVSQNKGALTQIIQVYDFVQAILDGISNRSISAEDRLKKQIESLVMYLEQALTALGLEKIDPDRMSDYYAEPDVELTESVPTENVEKDGKIKNVNYVGFRSRLPETDVRERYVVRPAKVSVYVLNK